MFPHLLVKGGGGRTLFNPRRTMPYQKERREKIQNLFLSRLGGTNAQFLEKKEGGRKNGHIHTR